MTPLCHPSTTTFSDDTAPDARQCKHSDRHGRRFRVDQAGHGMVAEPRLYQLVRERGSITDRTFEITFLAPGIEAYVFTFG